MVDPIETPRLRMRPFEESDAPAVFEVFSVPEVGEFVGGAHETIEASEKLVADNRAHQESHGFSYWALEERATDRLIGEVGLQLLEYKGPDVEIGWVVAKPAWGRGYATEAAQAWLDLGFTTLGLDEIIAVIRPQNTASHRVAQRLGMHRAGTRHAYERELDLYVARSPR
jgi:[ribosomal protein S5]-alanine N-acetyltransferase